MADTTKAASIKEAFNNVSEKYSPAFKEKFAAIKEKFSSFDIKGKLSDFKNKVFGNEHVKGAMDRFKEAFHKLGVGNIQQNAQAENEGTQVGE